MNFDSIFTPDNIKTWIENNLDKLHQTRSSGYQLIINRPHWFNDKSQKRIDNIPIFTGSTKEEIYLKMFRFCLENLKWDRGDKVVLYDYLIPYAACVKNNLSKGILSLENFVTVQNGEQVEIVAINIDSCNYMDCFIEDMLDDQLNFLGFFDGDRSYGGYDCCFKVKKVAIV